jgi:hypothetical protein
VYSFAVIAQIFARYVQGSRREKVSLQRNFAPFAQISVMHVQQNVENIKLSNARSVLKNAAKWQFNSEKWEK